MNEQRLYVQAIVNRMAESAGIDHVRVSIGSAWLGYLHFTRTIFCPESWLTALPSDEFEALLAHEIVHAKYGDELRPGVFWDRFPKRLDRAKISMLASSRLIELRTDREAISLIADPQALIRALRRIEPWRRKLIERTTPGGKGLHPPFRVRESNILRRAKVASIVWSGPEACDGLSSQGPAKLAR